MKKNITKTLLTFLLMFFLLILVNAQDEKKEFKNVTLYLLSGDTVQYKLSEIKADHINGYRRIKNKDVGLKFFVIKLSFSTKLLLETKICKGAKPIKKIKTYLK